MTGVDEASSPRFRQFGLSAVAASLLILALRASGAIDPAIAQVLAIIPLALVVIGVVAMLRSARIRQQHPAYRAYARRMGLAAAAYLSTILLAVGLLPDEAPPTLAPIAVALVPGAAVLAMIWALGKLLVELDDEYLRLLEVRKFIVATGFVLAVASVWGMLELLTQVPRLPIFYVFPIWCLGLAVGSVYNRVTMDGDGGCA